MRERLRRAARGVAKAPGAPASVFRVDDALEVTAEDFRSRGWAFVDPFFDKQTGQALIDGWPARSFFDPMQNIYKSYDFGFKWQPQTGQPKNLDRFPAIDRAYELMRSHEMARRITEYCGDGVERTCYATLLSWATSGSSLIPHLDTVAKDPKGAGFVNLIIFIDGTGGPQAGGTCIIEDNEYRNVLFEPHDLRNTCLIYKSGDERYYHGFKPMRPGTFRWAMNAEFAPPDYEPGA